MAVILGSIRPGGGCGCRHAPPGGLSLPGLEAPGDVLRLAPVTAAFA